MKRSPAATVETRVHYWPGLVDMLTSMLMFFLLLYFVESNFSSASAELAIARQKQARFLQVFQEEFRAEITEGQVAYSPQLNMLLVRFGEEVLFERGEHQLKPRGAQLLRRLASVFHQVGGAGEGGLYEQVQVEGHTDDRPFSRERSSEGYPRDNWELSTARATTVMRFLTGRGQALEERRFSVSGYSHNRPISERRSRNRRVEIRIYFSGRLTGEAAPAGREAR